MASGYFVFPTLHADTVAFVCDDDLWRYDVDKGPAYRLTAGESEHITPYLSRDGKMLAYVASEDGPQEVYSMATEDGEPRRLTFQDNQAVIRGWTPEGDIVYSSAAERPFYSEAWLYTIPADGGMPRRIPWGPALSVTFGPKGEVVLGRNTKDPSHWKRYRGGTMGELWIDANSSGPDRFEKPGKFTRLKTPQGNVATPCWVGERIFFVSDHEGIANVYSLLPDGQDLRRHTDHEEFYVRHLRTDGNRLVYSCGAELYLLDPQDEEPRRLDIHLGSSRSQTKRRFFSIDDVGIQSFALSPDGSRLGLVARGKPFIFANWEGPVVQLGKAEGVRYRVLDWLSDSKRVAAFASDESPDPYLVVFPLEPGGPARRIIRKDFGTVHAWWCSPASNWIAMTNHRNQVLLMNLDEKDPELHLIDASPHELTYSLAWSSDGRWLAYDFADTSRTRCIKLCRLEDRQVFQATRPVLQDFSPSFDPSGKYLYFVGRRDLNPDYDDVEFALGFPRSRKLYAIALKSDVPSPFIARAKPLESQAVQAKKKAEAELNQDVPPTDIEIEGLTERVMAFPLPAGRYSNITGLRDKVLFLQLDNEGGHSGTIEIYDLERQEQERLINVWVDDYAVAPDFRTVVYRHQRSLRVLPAEKYTGKGSGFNRSTGHIDLSRVRIPVQPRSEFRQMFRDAWRLQRDHFWDSEMVGIDWEEIYQRYLPLVEKVHTREEFGDLLWELFGELGTSHAYVQGGSYRKKSYYRQGFLGADWEWTGEGYRCKAIIGGDRWNESATSPLLQSGVGVKPGELLIAINGQPLKKDVPPGALLVNQAEQEVELTLAGDNARTVSVKALSSESNARYRDWVEKKRWEVHNRTDGRVGYIHVPDMGTEGYAEFHRSFLAECDREALIVDVRFNAGGNVSALLLQKLVRRRIGYTFPRWGSPVPYPHDSPRGPLVALTNEHAGSDGDIFSHAFKQLKLGPLIGRRTWGGVIGISPRYELADGTVTTQPEFSFFFDDVGWHLENRGTEPDIEVDNTPEDYFAERDPQLDKAVEVALQKLQESPAHTPVPNQRPRMGKIKLPPRS